MVRLLQLALLLQDLLLKLRISWIWYPAVSAETFMANNCVPLLGSTGTLWRPSITINSVPMLWQSVRWQLQQLAADLVRYWVLRILQLGMLLRVSQPKLQHPLAILPNLPLGNLRGHQLGASAEGDEKAVATFHGDLGAVAKIQRCERIAAAGPGLHSDVRGRRA